MRNAHGRDHGPHRNFKLREQNSRASNNVLRSGYLAWRQAVIRPGGDHDLLFAGAINHYECHTSGGVRITCRKADIDSSLSQQIHQLVALSVAANSPNKSDTRPESRRGHGLVGSLPASCPQKFGTVNGVAGSRKSFAADEVIHVDPSEDDNIE